MSEDLFFFLLFGGLIIFVVWIIVKENEQIQKSKQQLHKLVQQAGGSDIVIWREHKWGQKGYIQYVLLYTDANGVKQKHRVAQHWKAWGGLSKELFWDKPLQLPNIEPVVSISNSKEQIISEMDAEIKRLQEELRRVREER